MVDEVRADDRPGAAHAIVAVESQDGAGFPQPRGGLGADGVEGRERGRAVFREGVVAALATEKAVLALGEVEHPAKKKKSVNGNGIETINFG